MGELSPQAVASDVFDESLQALMAHSIRAIQNLFKKAGLTLEVLVIADNRAVLPLDGPPTGPTSILRSQLLGTTDPCRTCAKRVRATIFLHRFCTKNLARVCIAHELFHLMAELAQYEKGGKKV